MNYWWILLAVVVVVFMFSGGKVEKKGGKSVIHSFPTKLKSSARSLTSGNKMVIGVLVGLALCWFLGNGLVEGFDLGESNSALEFQSVCCDLRNNTRKTNFKYPELASACEESFSSNPELSNALCQSTGSRSFGSENTGGQAAYPAFFNSCCQVGDDDVLGVSEEVGKAPPVGASEEVNNCFKYAFNKTLGEIYEGAGVAGLMSSIGQLNEVCNNPG